MGHALHDFQLIATVWPLGNRSGSRVEVCVQFDVDYLRGSRGESDEEIDYLSFLARHRELIETWRRHFCLPRRDSSRRFLPGPPLLSTGGDASQLLAGCATYASL